MADNMVGIRKNKEKLNIVIYIHIFLIYLYKMSHVMIIQYVVNFLIEISKYC